MSATIGFALGALVVVVSGAALRTAGRARARRSVRVRLGGGSPAVGSWRSATPVGPVEGWWATASRRALGGRGRGDECYLRALPDALASLARALRAGTPFASALREAADSTSTTVGRDLVAAADELGHGRPVADVLAEWSSRRPILGVRLTVAALLMGTEVGGSRARAVDRVASRLRDQAAAAREVQALSIQARLSAVVIGGAPVAFAGLGMVGDGAVAHFLLATPAGWACLVGGLGLDVAAALWMRRIVRAAA
jgi:tight adherence protein B